ncbi:MAG: hypothetical protein NC417_11990, partial [Candidatus Gastranaerophilales bacterium]|nr:hypothetical protein [Candidatus Gastranaerophilales bacterium]
YQGTKISCGVLLTPTSYYIRHKDIDIIIVQADYIANGHDGIFDLYSPYPRCKQRGMEFETLQAVGYCPSRHSPTVHASMTVWLIARGNKL